MDRHVTIPSEQPALQWTGPRASACPAVVAHAGPVRAATPCEQERDPGQHAARGAARR